MVPLHPQFWNQGQISAGERSWDLILVFRRLSWRMSKSPIKPPPCNDWQDTSLDTDAASEPEEDSGVLPFCNAPKSAVSDLRLSVKKSAQSFLGVTAHRLGERAQVIGVLMTHSQLQIQDPCPCSECLFSAPWSICEEECQVFKQRVCCASLFSLKSHH